MGFCRGYPASVRVQANGKPLELPDGARVTDMLRILGLEAKPCAVEVNGRLAPRREHGLLQLAEGDRVEIVTLVGGG